MEANIAYYCLHKLHKRPHEYLELDEMEQAYVAAAVEIKIKNDKEAEKKSKQKSKGKRR